MLKVLVALIILSGSALAVSFPVAEKGLCYDGVEKLMVENVYPGAAIGYSSEIDHIWLILPSGNIVDTYYGEMSTRAAGYQAEKVFNSWKEFKEYYDGLNIKLSNDLF